MKGLHNIALAGVSLLTGIVIGQYGSGSAQASTLSAFLGDPDPDLLETRQASGYNFISPLLECDLSVRTASERIKGLEEDLRSYVQATTSDSAVTHVSVYFRDLNEGDWTGINFEDDFAPASLLKVPIMIAALRKAEADPSIINRSFEFDESVPVEPIDPSIVDEQIEFGKSYTYGDLVERMIVFSDNNAKNMLVGIIGDRDLLSVWTDLGVDLPAVNAPEDFISVRDYSAFFRVLYNGTYLSPLASEIGLEMLSRSSFAGGLRRGLPENVRVSSKFGERGFAGSDLLQLHDCGIVYSGLKPYMICVMTRGFDLAAQADAISALSRIVWEHQVAPIAVSSPWGVGSDGGAGTAPGRQLSMSALR